MSGSSQERGFMIVAVGLAKVALKTGNAPVGAIVVFNGQIIGKGIESVRPIGEITSHAEILAIRDAIHKKGSATVQNSILYTTHEPCIMCAYILRHYKIGSVVYGVPVNYVGGVSSSFGVLSTEEVPKWGKSPKIIGGICEKKCKALNEQYEKYSRLKY